MTIRCPSCKTVEAAYLGSIPAGSRFAGMNLSQPLPPSNLYHCSECHLSFKYPTPDRKTLDALYEKAELTHWQYDATHRVDWNVALPAIRRLTGRPRVLDVGCFDGAFLRLLGEAERFGIEPNTAARERARTAGTTMVGSDVKDLAKCDHVFDIITMFNLVEHVTDPRDLVRLAADRLDSGGLLILSSGNTEAQSWRAMGSRYWYCALPEHLAFISDSWCQKLAADRGWELDELVHYAHDDPASFWRRTYQATANMVYRMAPAVARRLRRAGLGEVDTSGSSAFADEPPMWTASRDQLVAIFRTP